MKEYEDAGAQRVIIMLGHRSGSQAFRYVHFFAPDEMEEILERLAENSGLQLLAASFGHAAYDFRERQPAARSPIFIAPRRTVAAPRATGPSSVSRRV